MAIQSPAGLALAAMLAGGLHGIEQQLSLEDELVGNAYDSDAPHVPQTLRDAASLDGATTMVQTPVA